MGVTLYTSRVVLDKLGADDYGLYECSRGVIVAMLGFLNGTLSISTSRFITFELGTGSLERQKRTFFHSIDYTSCSLWICIQFFLKLLDCYSFIIN